MSDIQKFPNTIKFWYNHRNAKQGLALYYDSGKEEMQLLKENTGIEFIAGQNMMVNIIYNEQYAQKFIEEGTICKFFYNGEVMNFAIGEKGDFLPIHKMDVDGYETILRRY